MIERIVSVLEKNLCDHCLGRTCSQLLSESTNEERGRTIRKFMAMMVDASIINYSGIDLNNFYGLKFRQKKIEDLKKEKCWLCNNLFDSMDSMFKKAEAKLNKIDFDTFLVGSKVPDIVLNREEKLWERIGIEYVESIKSEINRELGKKIGLDLGKDTNFKNPEVVVLVDFVNKKIDLQINSLYIFGKYQKLVRGIPQCKWGTPDKYKSSVQEIIAKPIVKAVRGSGNAFHGMGREDVDARCLGWRPFVIEITEPKTRKISLKKIKSEINRTKKVKVDDLKFTDRFTVVRLKSEKGDKTYRLTVVFDRPVEKKELKKLKGLIGSISQQTPQRVVHRRADIIRRRVVKELKYEFINRKKIELTVRTNAGLYVKELVSGDNGRTNPSVAGILNVKATPKDLDVVRVESPKNL